MPENVKPFNISEYKVIANMTDNDINVFVVMSDEQYEVICVDAYCNIFNRGALYDSAYEACIVASLHIAHEYYLTHQLEFDVQTASEDAISNIRGEDELLTAI